MAQKSISSFFSKAPAKKTPPLKEEKENAAEEKEIPAKTKPFQDSNSSSTSSQGSATLTAKTTEVIDVESKENNKALAENETPPLRKTAINPAFKNKQLSNDNSSQKENENSETEPVKNDAKTKSKKIEEKKETKKNKRKSKSSEDDELKETKPKSPVKSKRKLSSSEEDASPVKIRTKKKKAVIESDEDEAPMETSVSEKDDLKTEDSSKLSKKSPQKLIKSPKKESPMKEEKSPKKEVKSPKEEAKASPKKEKKPVSSFFSPKPTASKKSKESDPEVKSEPSTPDAEKKKKNAFAGFFSPKPGSVKRNEGGTDYDEKVQKASYHPINDAFWTRDEPTPFLALAKTLEAIEATSGRLKTIEILSNYFRSCIYQTPGDLLPSVYMTLGRLAPAWEGVELGIGDTILMKAIGISCGRSNAQIKADNEKIGDLGLVAEQSRGGQRTMFQPAILTVPSVFRKLQEIAKITGSSSGNKKVDLIQSLLVACRSSEARYVIRSLAGKLRIGMAEQSVLQALAQATVQTPLGQEYPPEIHTSYKATDNDKFKEVLGKESLKLKTAYCECPSYDLLIPALLSGGVDKLKETCKLTPGIPLKPMLAHPTKGVQEVLTRFENCAFTCEWKYDGERAQIHLHEDGKVNIFSRNQEDNTSKYPDIIKRLPNCLGENVKSAVLDCEAVAWDREAKQIQPFQVLSTRKRKDAVEEEIKVQVCLFAFDLLYLNGEALVTKPFNERRELLRNNFVLVENEFQYAKSVDGKTTEEIQEALEDSIKDNCEGLMVKTLDVDATYEIARRSHNWLKLKKDYLDGVGDTIDLVVIGGYLGKGKRTGFYGGFLLACYDPENEEYQSICKIGTGFSDEDLAKHAAFFKDNLTDKAKAYYNHDPSLAPDHWFEPVQVWEIKCADLSISPVHRAALGIVDSSKGISLRFPRFLRIRDDKKPEDATSAEQIATMYNSQDIIKNATAGKKSNPEDDFDF